MKFNHCSSFVYFLIAVIKFAQPTCVLESDFGFKINCAFKKSGLFRVRNLGGIKAHASVGLSLGDELGFEQSLTNMDPSRRRSVSNKNGSPPNLVADTTVRSESKPEKRVSKQSKVIKSNLTTTDKQTSIRKLTVISEDSTESVSLLTGINSTITMTKPQSTAASPLNPIASKKEDSLKVLPMLSTKKTTSKKETSYTPLQIPQSTRAGLFYKNPVLNQVNDLATLYPGYNTKKADDYNSVTGYNDDRNTNNYKDNIKAKIAEIAKAGNISMEAVEAAIALRQQQLLNKYANIHIPKKNNNTTITEEPQTPKKNQSTKVMNAPREYYPIGYEKNFDDHFQSKVDLPESDFYCADQKYFPGLYGDESLGCMIFHVCALTENGLIMKSFLCPESTLFDQTILKCNWWFYVDCKNTKRMYDTNTPVSKSYQLMKALAFFSSHRKDMQDDGSGRTSDANEADSSPITNVSTLG